MCCGWADLREEDRQAHLSRDTEANPKCLSQIPHIPAAAQRTRGKDSHSRRGVGGLLMPPQKEGRLQTGSNLAFHHHHHHVVFWGKVSPCQPNQFYFIFSGFKPTCTRTEDSASSYNLKAARTSLSLVRTLGDRSGLNAEPRSALVTFIVVTTSLTRSFDSAV